jgi:hypothetical protein
MAVDVFSFYWPVPIDGHRWIQARVYERHGDESRLKDEPEWILTEGIAMGETRQIKRYAPLDEAKALFRNFAALRYEDRDALLRFANEYGTLGIKRFHDKPIERDGRHVMGVGGETWADWIHEVIAMRRAIEIWEMVVVRDVTGLLRHIQWADHKDRGQSQWVYWSHPEVREGGNEALLALLPLLPGEAVSCVGIPPVLNLFNSTDVFLPALFLVQNWINEHLNGAASPQLRYHVRRDVRVIQIIPDSLLAAMWLQFAQAVAGNRQHRACKECGRWFELSTEGDGFRINRLFCSDPCKSKDYRRRKERARSLKREGKTITVIAKELDTPIDTIKNWLSNRKG